MSKSLSHQLRNMKMTVHWNKDPTYKRAFKKPFTTMIQSHLSFLERIILIRLGNCRIFSSSIVLRLFCLTAVSILKTKSTFISVKWKVISSNYVSKETCAKNTFRFDVWCINTLECCERARYLEKYNLKRFG